MRNKVVEIHQSGKGYKAICEAPGLQRTTFRTINHKWLEMGAVGVVPGARGLPKSIQGVINEPGTIK